MRDPLDLSCHVADGRLFNVLCTDEQEFLLAAAKRARRVLLYRSAVPWDGMLRPCSFCTATNPSGLREWCVNSDKGLRSAHGFIGVKITCLL